jgi:hypothetical protein
MEQGLTVDPMSAMAEIFPVEPQPLLPQEFSL